MQLLITGSHGLIGSSLIASLSGAGHQILRLVRGSATQADEVAWDPSRGTIDAAGLEGLDAVVHLAGESIAARRWTKKQKQKILDSRVLGTTLLVNTLAALAAPPKVLVAASAIGFYGDRGDEIVDECSSAGQGFLPQVCQQWEAACQPAHDRGIRTANLRFGVVLAGDGGALKKMLLPFRLGLGGKIGSGRQWMSWIAVDDAVGAIQHVLAVDHLFGPVNAVAPQPVTNAEFTTALGMALSRPTIFPLPAPVARVVLGEMADALLLASTRVKPTQLAASGYAFRLPELSRALDHVL